MCAPFLNQTKPIIGLGRITQCINSTQVVQSYTALADCSVCNSSLVHGVKKNVLSSELVAEGQSITCSMNKSKCIHIIIFKNRLAFECTCT